MAVASSTARSIALVALCVACGACDHDKPAKPPETIAKGAPPLAAKAFFRVDAPPLAPCPSGTTCEAQLVLTALGDYHVNDDYPFKLVGDPASEVAIQGEGTFKPDGAKQGTLTVRFTPSTPGQPKLVGTFKLSVCNADNCQIESPKISLRVPSS
jgi:hypothetical protein